jgi:hypothetical protein
MDRESELLIASMLLVGTAVAAVHFPTQTFDLLWALLAGALLAWASRKRAE